MSSPAPANPDRVEDQILWRSVAATLREVLAPALPPGHELDTARQLQGLARYAVNRAEEDAPHRMDVLTRSLGTVGPVPHLPSALARASDVLVDAIQAPGDRRLVARAKPVRAALLQLLDEDIATAAPLLDGFTGRPRGEDAAADQVVPAVELAALQTWFGRALGGRVRLTRVVVMPGGHSRRMLRVELLGSAGPESFVLRLEQAGTFATDGNVEAEAMLALHAAGIALAPVRWVERDRRHLGQPFFVMDLLDGKPTVDDDGTEQFLQALAAVHQVGTDLLASALGPPPEPERAVQQQVDRWAHVYRDSVQAPVPLLDEAAAWLRSHLAPTGPAVVVHGRPGPDSCVHAAGAVTALTDWEFVHYGDAAEDWSYVATERRERRRAAADWYVELERVVGVHHDHATWHAWEVFNQFKGACANLTALRLFREGSATTPDLLAIGTAVHYRFLRRLADLIAERPCRLPGQ